MRDPVGAASAAEPLFHRSPEPIRRLLTLAAMFVLSVPALHGQSGPANAPAALSPPLRGELPGPAPVFLPQPQGITVTPVASGLQNVWSLQFAPDGRLFITERIGRVRILRPDGVLDPVPWLEVPQVMRKEDGLLGLALDPAFPTEPWVYVFYTVRKGDELVNRISRFREVNGRAGDEEVLIDDLASSITHNGGRLRFGPDGMLYISVGDIEQGALSQDLSNLYGTILRIAPDGSIPSDNPWPGSPMWAYGLRNVGALAFRPGDGALFAGDHGPSGEWGPLRISSRDEINVITKGGNYGWPLAVGAPNHPSYIDPILAWIPSQPPGDLAFYDADLIPDLKGDLLYTTLRGGTMMRIRFEDQADTDRATSVEWWFHDGQMNGSRFGRLRGMAVGPDGAIYIGTSNVERGDPEDLILRVAPTP